MAAPLGPLNTTGTGTLPALMYSCLAPLLMIWSIACIEKLKVMNSTTGRKSCSIEQTFGTRQQRLRVSDCSSDKHYKMEVTLTFTIDMMEQL
eukprot:18631-Heterococcus_DN1.PRE.2